MREIRIFELEYEEPAHALRLARPLHLQVSKGELWLTVDGDPADYWLRAGDALTLAGGASVRISAGRPGARFAMASGAASARALTVRGVAGRLADVWRERALRGAARVRAAS